MPVRQIACEDPGGLPGVLHGGDGRRKEKGKRINYYDKITVKITVVEFGGNMWISG